MGHSFFDFFVCGEPGCPVIALEVPWCFQITAFRVYECANFEIPSAANCSRCVSRRTAASRSGESQLGRLRHGHPQLQHVSAAPSRNMCRDGSVDRVFSSRDFADKVYHLVPQPTMKSRSAMRSVLHFWRPDCIISTAKLSATTI